MNPLRCERRGFVTTMQPYYSENGITIYHGDCREVLPYLRPTAIVTDPTWPNASVPLFGADDPLGMFAAMWGALETLPLRAAIQLGCDSDPRFLTAVPAAINFFRVACLVAKRGR